MNESWDEVLYCKRHPQVETALRCYQCGTPICPKCARRTPVGYLCPDCHKGRKQRFDQSRSTDYIIATVVSLVFGGLAGWFLPSVGWFVIFLSPISGTFIAEAVWRMVGRRHGLHLWWIVAGGIVLGGAPRLVLSLLGGVLALSTGYVLGFTNVLWCGVHLVLAVGAAVARLRLQ